MRTRWSARRPRARVAAETAPRDIAPLRLLIAGGGTGGHVYPALALAEEVRRVEPRADILFLGTARGLEARVVPPRGFTLETIDARGLPRRLTPGAFAALFHIARGFVQVAGRVQSFRPDVLVGTGGYVSAPALFAAGLFRRPLVIQEQNATPGIANRLLAGAAREIHTAFPAARDWFRRYADRVLLTGNPLRAGIAAGNREAAAAAFGLDPSRATVLIFGGSLGARSLNAAVRDAAPALAAGVGRELQFVVQTGAVMEQEVAAACRAAGLAAHVAAFVEDMNGAYALADFTVCRAGAMTLAEITACGLPSVLVPYPYAAHDHQMANARDLEAQGAADVIADSDLTPAALVAAIERLHADPARRAAMSAKARAAAKPHATQELVQAIYRVAGRPAPAALTAAVTPQHRETSV